MLQDYTRLTKITQEISHVHSATVVNVKRRSLHGVGIDILKVLRLTELVSSDYS